MVSIRRFGTKCAGCDQGILPEDLVRWARDKVYHIPCFTCVDCHKELSTGDVLYILDDDRLLCKSDYLTSRHHRQGKLYIFSHLSHLVFFAQL